MKSHHRLAAGSPKQYQGRIAEDHALRRLLQAGHHLLARNYHCRAGEIDLITLSAANVLVFTEVRWRRNLAYGGALASVTLSKQRRLIVTARHFLACHPVNQIRAMRFDVFGLTGLPPHWQCHWIRGAFAAA